MYELPERLVKGGFSQLLQAGPEDLPFSGTSRDPTLRSEGLHKTQGFFQNFREVSAGKKETETHPAKVLCWLPRTRRSGREGGREVGPSEAPAGGTVLPGLPGSWKEPWGPPNPVTSWQLQFIAAALIP